jgi:hypothetical protein
MLSDVIPELVLEHLREFGIGVVTTVILVGVSLFIPMLAYDPDVFFAVDECQELDDLNRDEAAKADR